MESELKAPIVNEELRKLLADHSEVQGQIDAENRKRVPDSLKVSGLKRQKLRIRDEMAGIIAALPPSAYKPIDPRLFAMSDDELQMKLLKQQRMLDRRAARVGQNAFELSNLRSKLGDVEFEIERRNLQELFPEKQVSKAA